MRVAITGSAPPLLPPPPEPLDGPPTAEGGPPTESPPSVYGAALYAENGEWSRDTDLQSGDEKEGPDFEIVD